MIGGNRRGFAGAPGEWPGAEVAGRRWAAELAELLDGLRRQLRRLADQVGTDWPDAAGRAWSDRADEVCRELDAQVRRARQIGPDPGSGRPGDPHVGCPGPGDPSAGDPSAGDPRAADPRAAEPRAAEPRAADAGLQDVGPPRPGVRLGGTTGRRASDERGVRIPELPPPG